MILSVSNIPYTFNGTNERRERLRREWNWWVCVNCTPITREDRSVTLCWWEHGCCYTTKCVNFQRNRLVVDRVFEGNLVRRSLTIRQIRNRKTDWKKFNEPFGNNLKFSRRIKSFGKACSIDDICDAAGGYRATKATFRKYCRLISMSMSCSRLLAYL